MSAKSSFALALGLLALDILGASSALAQVPPASPLSDQLKAQYKLAAMGPDFSITEAGTVLVIQADGILGVPPGSSAVCSATFSDGVLQPPSATAPAYCATIAHKLESGEKVYPLKLEVYPKQDRVSLLVAGCGACDETPQSAAYKSQILFQFPKGYLGAADVSQIEDVIGLVLPIDTSPHHSSPGSLTNKKIIEMVKAKVPDSVIIATMTSSKCDFVTTPDNLIKLKTAGVSDPLLEAMVGAMKPPDPEPPPPPPICGDFGSCISSGNAALASGQWEEAIAQFQAASALDATKPEAWQGLADANLGATRKDEAVAKWDKALNLGGPLIFTVCHHGALFCMKGNLILSPKRIAFTTMDGKALFTVPPSEVNSAEVIVHRIYEADELQLKIAGKKYTLYLVPFAVTCRNQEAIQCPPEGIAQQFTAFTYISQAIPKLAAGTLGPPLR